MPRPPTSALALTVVLALTSCSLISDARDEISDATSSASSSSSSSGSAASSSSTSSPSSNTRPPRADVVDLVLPVDDIPDGTKWQAQRGDSLEEQLGDHPATEDGGIVDPRECTEAALVTRGPDGADTDFAGASGSSSDGTALPALAVITDGRTIDDLRSAREECSETTARRDGMTMTLTESVADGPDIQGAETSFAFDGTYEVDGGTPQTFDRYGIVAEVRDTLVVVVINPNDHTFDGKHTTTTLSARAKGEAATIATAQVERIASAN